MMASMVRPGTRVVSISGDGGFPFSAEELETATRAGLSFTHAIVRDNAYGMAALQGVPQVGNSTLGLLE
jgi:acetolactate synthase-1/2/3 large subunit